MYIHEFHFFITKLNIMRLLYKILILSFLSLNNIEFKLNYLSISVHSKLILFTVLIYAI